MSKSLGKVTKVATLGLVDTKGPKAPATPNYSQLATQQAGEQQNIAEYLTAANRPNQVDAMGNSVTWSKDPATGQWTQKQTWNPGTVGQFYQQQHLATQGGYLAEDKLAGLKNQKDFKSPDMPQYDSSSADSAKKLYDKGVKEAQNQGDFSYDALPKYDEANGKAVSDATYNAMTARVRPEQQRQQDALSNQLRLQGLQPGTEAFNRAMQNMYTSHADADYLASQNATIAGYDGARQRYLSQLQGQGQQFDQELTKYQMPWEKLAAAQGNYQGMMDTAMNKYLGQLQGQGQDFNQKLEAYQLPWEKLAAAQGNYQGMMDTAMNKYLGQLQGQGQEFGQRLTEHQLPWQEAQMAMGFAGDRYTPPMPGFSGATGYNPADQIGAANAGYQAQMGQYNAQNQKKGQTLGAGASVGAALLSDEELKKDITELDGKESLKKLLEIGGYSWTWKDSELPDVGVIAQRVQAVMKNLINTEEPYLRVNYTGLVGMCIAALGYLAEVSNADV